MSNTLNELLQGAVSGLVATGPMTLVMEMLHRILPREERPLPWPVITERALQTVGVADELSREEKKAATVAMHYGYGTMAGSLYGPLSRWLSLPPLLGGIGYGLAVGTAGYLGWLPLTKLYRSTLRETPQRNLMLIIGHCVWGAVLGILADRLRSDE